MRDLAAVLRSGLPGRVLSACFAAGLGAALSALPAFAGEAEWRRLYEQVDLHFQNGSFEQAELFAREALQEAESSLGENHRATELSLGKAVFVLRLRGKYEEALALAVRGVNVSTRLYGAGD